jgi:hypothetical protein
VLGAVTFLSVARAQQPSTQIVGPFNALRPADQLIELTPSAQA